MRQDWFMAALLGVSMLGTAQQQQPKVLNAQFHTEPVGAGLSATVDRFQHSGGPLWLGYEVSSYSRNAFLVRVRARGQIWKVNAVVSID